VTTLLVIKMTTAIVRGFIILSWGIPVCAYHEGTTYIARKSRRVVFFTSLHCTFSQEVWGCNFRNYKKRV